MTVSTSHPTQANTLYSATEKKSVGSSISPATTMMRMMPTTTNHDHADDKSDICPPSSSDAIRNKTISLDSTATASPIITTMSMPSQESSTARTQRKKQPHLPHDPADQAGRKARRPNFPTTVTNILKSWLLSHTDNPYPSDEEKQALCEECDITLKQVEDWFINGRRRILRILVSQDPKKRAATESSRKGRPASDAAAGELTKKRKPVATSGNGKANAPSSDCPAAVKRPHPYEIPHPGAAA